MIQFDAFLATMGLDLDASRRRAEADAQPWSADDLPRAEALLMAWVPATERETWIAMGHALKRCEDEEAARSVWHRWSATCPEKYSPQAADAKWDEFEPSRTGLGAIEARARRHGYREQAAEEFEPMVPSDGSGASNPPTVPAQGAQGPSGGASAGEYAEEPVAERIAREQHPVLKVAGSDPILFEGTRWSRDDSGARIFDLSRRYLDDFARQAEGDPNLGRNGPAIARSLRRAATAAGVAKFVRFDRRLWVPPDALDAMRDVLNTPAGTIELRTGAMRPHSPADLITKITAVGPDATMPAPLFRRVLREITADEAGNPDPAMVDFLQVAFGYGITGDVSLHALFFLYGSGRNGKNLLVDAIMDVLGDYAGKVPATMLLTDPRGERHPSEIADLFGLRFAVGSELNENVMFDEARVKELTGDARLKARRMYGDWFEFERLLKLFLMANTKPRLRSVDPAMRSRIKIIPFRQSFEGREDRTLPERLRAEYPAILAWLVEGARRYYADRALPHCAAVERASADYFDSQSTIERWIDERCERAAGARTAASALFADYKEWKLDLGEQPRSQTAFGEVLQRSFPRVRGASGFAYTGIRLRRGAGFEAA